jgi:hypothetical protein
VQVGFSFSLNLAGIFEGLILFPPVFGASTRPYFTILSL